MATGEGKARLRGGAGGTLRAWASRVRELWPLTRLGTFVVALSGVGLRYIGVAQLDLVWYTAALGALALVALSVLLVCAGALVVLGRLRAGRGEAPEPAARTTSFAFESGFRLTRLRLWPLLESRLAWSAPSPLELSLEPRAGGEAAERVALADYGELRHVSRRVSVCDVLGLSAVTLRHEAPVHWDVLPHKGALRQVPWLSSMSAGDDIPHPLGLEAGDRLELRRYAPGDPARFIHWKVYARTQKLVVRVPERALSRTHRTAAYLVSGAGDAPSAAAVLAAMEAGAFGDDWVFGADGGAGLARTPAEVEAAVRGSAHARDAGGRGLAAFVAEASQQGPVALMLFVPPRHGPWLEAVRAVLHQHGLRPCVIVGVDGLAAPKKTALWRRALWLGEGEAAPPPDVSSLVAELRGAGADVRVADRVGGRLVGDGLNLVPPGVGAQSPTPEAA